MKSSILQEPKNPFSHAIKKKNSADGRFNFNFVKNNTVKAVVARKRIIKPTHSANSTNETSTKPSTFSSQSSFSFKNPSNSGKLPKVERSNKSASEPDEDLLLNFAKVKKPEDDSSLSLNVERRIDSSRPLTRPTNEKKKKLTREERKERGLQRRIEEAKAKHAPRPAVASKKEMRKMTSSLFGANAPVPTVGSRLVKPLSERVFTGFPMASIGLHPHLVKSMADLMGITELTQVQQLTVPVLLEGRDILVRSQTGSGKTLAYALPLVQQLQAIEPRISRGEGIRAIIIVPSRELAIQTLDIFIKLLKPFTWIVPTYITGGEKRKSEKARIRKGINIVIGTPGRICDHILHTESFKLDNVQNLILDEADRLFELGYEKDVKIIVDELNKKQSPFGKADEPKKTLQTVLLSATLSPSVHQLAGLALKNPLYVDTCNGKNKNLKTSTPCGDQNETEIEEVAVENIVIPETVTQKFILVPPKLRLVTLSGLIAKETVKSSKKIIVFMATENLVDYHYDIMTEVLTKNKIDSDDESDDGDEVGTRRGKNRKNKKSKSNDPIALLNNSDSELEDEEDYLAKAKDSEENDALLDNVKFFK